MVYKEFSRNPRLWQFFIQQCPLWMGGWWGKCLFLFLTPGEVTEPSLWTRRDNSPLQRMRRWGSQDLASGGPRRIWRPGTEEWQQLTPAQLLDRPGALWSTLHTLLTSSYHKSVRGYFSYPHFMGEEIETQRSSMTCSRALEQNSISRVHALKPNNHQLWLDPRQEGYVNTICPIQPRISIHLLLEHVSLIVSN